MTWILELFGIFCDWNLLNLLIFQVLNNIDRTVISKVQPMEPKIFYTNIKTWIHRTQLSVDHHYKCVKHHHFHWNRQIDAISQLLHKIHKIDTVPVVSNLLFDGHVCCICTIVHCQTKRNEFQNTKRKTKLKISLVFRGSKISS